MEIHGLNKTTLLDYPGHVACTLFTGHCNFRCPFCQNADLVIAPTRQPLISEDEFWTFLEKRHSVLEGICITGGEPTLQGDLKQFIQRCREYELKIKLDTNGSDPEVIQELWEAKLIDYVAMDIKSSLRGYSAAIGRESYDTGSIRESVSFLMNSTMEYEFRTTVMQELHNRETFEEIGEWLKGCKAYFLQSYKESDRILLSFLSEDVKECYPQGFHPYSGEELRHFVSVLEGYQIPAALRGVD